MARPCGLGEKNCEVSEMDWKEIFTGDFLVNMLSVLVALFVWEKWLKKMLRV